MYPVKIIFPRLKTLWLTRYQHLYTPILFSFASLNYFVGDALRILVDTIKHPWDKDLNLAERWFVILVQASAQSCSFYPI